MATTTAVPVTVEEYLNSVYRPDMDYVDGTLEERNAGEFDHADVQWAVLEALNAFTPVAGIRARPEVRVQVAPKNFRIPDVCVMPANWKRTPVVRTPPLVCVEIASPRDTIRSLTQRCHEYLAMGVPEAWVLEPADRRVHVIRPSGASQHIDGLLELPGLPFSVEVSRLFKVLNEE